MDEFIEHYTTGAYEHERLTTGAGRLEFERTVEILDRYLPPPPASVLDVGGAAGVYASWLADRGDDVHVVDAVQLHVEQARDAADGRFTAAVGDARSLDEPDASRDVVLLLGPLYHLTERAGRVAALREAVRVVRPGGLIAVAAIVRFASLLDGLHRERLGDARFRAIVERDLRDGQHRNPDREPGWFTTAFFHHPDELIAELRTANLEPEGVFNLDWAGWLLGAERLDRMLDDADGREHVLWASRAVEREPSLAGLGPHLLAIARRP